MTSSKLNANATILNANHRGERRQARWVASGQLSSPLPQRDAAGRQSLRRFQPASARDAAECARDLGELADAGELGLAFNNLGASQLLEWTDGTFVVASTQVGEELANTSSRQILIGYTDVNSA